MKTLLILLAALAALSCNLAPSSPPAPAASASTTSFDVEPPPPSRLDVLRQRAANAPPPATYVDTRSEAEKAAAACSGSWCRGAGIPKPKLAAGTSTPIIPPSWTVSAWFIDPANSATCASDSNSGTSATCTGGCNGAICTSGIGPLKTYQELLVHRWGCIGNPQWCPRLRQTTTLTFLSSHTDNSDPVSVSAGLEQGAFLILQGQLTAAQQVCTGTMAVVSAKNRATPQLLVVTLPCAAAANELVVDSTTSSRFWTYSSAGGGNWNTTQPLSPVSTSTWAKPAEVIPVNGDTVTVYQPTQVNLQNIGGTVADANAGFNNNTVIYQLNGFDPQGAANDQMTVSTSSLTVAEAQLQRIEVNNGTGSAINNQNYQNVLWTGGLISTAPGININGGAVSPTAFEFAVLVEGSANFDRDFQMGLTSNVSGWHMATGFYVASAQSLILTSGYNASMTGIVWGPGTLNVGDSTRLTYPPGATGGATNFKLTGAMQLNGQTKACIVNPAAATSYGTCNLGALTGAVLDANLGATSGCLGGPGGFYCNF